MKIIDVNIFLIIILITIINADQTIRRLPYKLDGDISSFEGGNIIHFELTFIDSSASTSTLEIETEQWVHDCCLEITTSPILRIHLKNHNGNYPKITAYLNLRKPLSSIILTGAATLTTVNSLTTDTFSLKLSEASEAQMNVEINSNLHVTVSDAAKLIMSGFVKGTGNVHVTDAGKVSASSCPMNIVIVDVSDAGTAYVVGEQAVDVTESDAGEVIYKGPLRKQNQLTSRGSIKSSSDMKSTASNISSKILTYYYMFFLMFYFIFSLG